jgi:hypothetical protein
MNAPLDPLAQRHRRLGWYALLAFASLGLSLEALHAFKAGFYLDVGAETRRSLWRLAHAHGALLGLVNLAFASTLAHTRETARTRLELASACFIGGTLLLPAGFFIGGAFARGGDPGAGILLVPVGALLFVLGSGLTARSLR